MGENGNNAYNNDEIYVLRLSEAGGEGLNLVGTRYFQMLEPLNSTSENRAIARAVRFRSHTHLPYNEQHVEVFRYMCVMPTYRNAVDIGRFPYFPRNSGDTFLRNICVRKDQINGPFGQLMMEAAQDNEYKCFQPEPLL